MNRNEAAVGSVLFFFLAPGTVAGLVPWLITRWRFGDGASASLKIAGGVVIAVGLAALIECFARFARQGEGTPAPVAPTAKLVIGGLYGFVRNPMYVAVLTLVFGQMLLFANAALLAYGIALWMAFFLFVALVEEPRLKRDFGEAYEDYCAHVPRWIPRLTPWRPA